MVGKAKCLHREVLNIYIYIYIYIQLERDYLANDNKGILIHFSGKDENNEGDIALIRIENGSLFWYENQNGEYICDSASEYVADENIKLICQYLLKQFPEAEIDTSELKSK